MPFRSRAQQDWAFATKQPFAKAWADETDQRALPARLHPHTTRHFAPKHQAKVVR